MGKIRILTIVFLVAVYFTGCKNFNKKSTNTSLDDKELKPIIVSNKSLVGVNDGYIDTPIKSNIEAVDADNKTKKFAYIVNQSQDAPDKQHPYPDVDIGDKIYVNNNKNFVMDVDSVGSSLKFFSDTNSFAYKDNNGISIANKKSKNQVFKSKVYYFSWNPKNKNEVAILLGEGGNINRSDYIYSVLIFNIKNKQKSFIFKKTLNDINEVVFAPNGKDLFYAINYPLPGGKERNELRKINIKNKSSKLLNSRIMDHYFALSASPNGKWLTFINININLQLMNLASKKIYTFKKINLNSSSATTSWLSNNELLINNFSEINKVKFKFIDEKNN